MSLLNFTLLFLLFIQSEGLIPAPTNKKIDKGYFNILENASKILPQGQIVQTAKKSWNLIWRIFMTELAPQSKDGTYERPIYQTKGWIGTEEFPDENERYHLYLGNPCPWCHRVRLAVALLRFTPEQIGITYLVDDPVKASRGGWVFDDNVGIDPLHSNDLVSSTIILLICFLFERSERSLGSHMRICTFFKRELYEKVSPGFKGRCTAPLLIDLKTNKIVSNESADIVRMLNLVDLGQSREERQKRINLYPKDLAATIDETNDWVYHLINNGVYRCGFSTQQGAYDKASSDVRQGLEQVEAILGDRKFLCSDDFTEADLRLLPTILRYDGAYSPLFKAGGVNLRIRDFPNILNWLQRCWDIEGVKESIDLEDAVSSYYRRKYYCVS
jgi:glutathionyl-hydroquinone reductase